MSLLILLVLPLAGAAAARRRVSAVAVDTWVARGSLACLAAGSAMVGWASVFGGGGGGSEGQGMAVALVVVGLVLASVGNGITQTMRGLVAHFAQGRRPAGGDGRGGDNEGERRREGEGAGSRMGQLYAGIALLELIAVLTGEMAFAALFGLGTRLSSGDGEGGGGSGSWWVKGWMGLPFYAAAVSSAISLFDLQETTSWNFANI